MKLISPDQTISKNAKRAIGVLYIFIVLLGSYFAQRSWLGSEGDHYFASRKNLVNRLFVKKGWFWFTVVFWGSFALRRIRPTFRQALLRFAAATLWWVLFTQWLFGAPIMDRVFTYTGGYCEVDPLALKQAAALHGKHAKLPITSAQCRGTGGSWSGGHDPSGHVFILVQSSLVLWMEILPDMRILSAEGQRIDWGVRIPLILLSLWATMLFLTSVYFHSTSEKLSGLFSGLIEPYIVYVWGETAQWGELFGVNFGDAEVTSEKTDLQKSPQAKRAGRVQIDGQDDVLLSN